MVIVKAKNYEDMSVKAANIMAAQITLKPDSVLGLATGSTPEGLYSNLIKKYEAGELDFSKIKTVNLDEYKGLTRDHDQSYYYFMNDKLFNHVNIDKANTNVPDGTKEDGEAECARYEALIDSLGGTDIQLLGIGGNGHIGFNEPDESFIRDTHCVKLTDSTIEANSRFFASKDDVPKYAYTMGIGSIMKSKKILLVASGKGKAKAIYDTVCGPITPSVPASILQLHPDVVIVADEEALSLIK
ncbi:MAG: glucosamine-6-phosphate deaminase [Clostridia bacterium]|nr:glucosamine-6-phosphate deaminase [Clostridia bacterium]